MTNTSTLAPWETFVTPQMVADAKRQAAKLIRSGHTVDAAAAEAAAWIRMRAIRSRMLSSVR